MSVSVPRALSSEPSSNANGDQMEVRWLAVRCLAFTASGSGCSGSLTPPPTDAGSGLDVSYGQTPAPFWLDLTYSSSAIAVGVYLLPMDRGAY